MKRAMLLLGLAGCATVGTAEDFTWTVQIPSSVAPGAVFAFTVRSTRATGQVASGVGYHYQVRWPGGVQAAHGTGASGEPQKVKALLVSGPATLVVICPDRKGQEVEVQIAPFEVK